MNDAVDRLIIERAALDRGFSRGLVLSVAAHVLLVGAAIAGPILFPKKPTIKVMGAFAVPLPPGGGGSPAPANPAPAPQKPEPEQKAPPAPEPPKREILKPPKEEKKGLPAPDAKPVKKTPATPRPAAAASGGQTGGTGTASQTPGIGVGPVVGPGFPGGTDPNGDWYQAGVGTRIWQKWTLQVKSGMTVDIVVRFTILADGSVTDVQLTQPSGVYLLDSAAQRAVMNAAPFGPLPKHYGTDRYTMQARFSPTQ